MDVRAITQARAKCFGRLLGSGEGITMRLEIRGGAMNMGSYNNALQVAALVYGVQYFKMAGPQPKY